MYKRQVLYAEGQEWLHKKHIMGRACGYLPKVGIVTIIMNDYPYVKYLVIGVLAILVRFRPLFMRRRSLVAAS